MRCPCLRLACARYGRVRCYDNLFTNVCGAGDTTGHFIGYSVRTPDTRYVKRAVQGRPLCLRGDNAAIAMSRVVATEARVAKNGAPG